MKKSFSKQTYIYLITQITRKYYKRHKKRKFYNRTCADFDSYMLQRNDNATKDGKSRLRHLAF
ncbi:hypothetical protein HMPREF9420_2453 [Segatella salivae DSM 15606]|uniref:Uncharacterized protein n=1 Tax=Segatella salivae DSM 15606 TaxID=888832 RepID=E6MSI5_9BACT|nr:hypothetical protein HMPREF9420_2453 [Segatella salivae DSM 15606]